MHTLKDIEDLAHHDPVVHACYKAKEAYGWSLEEALIEMVWHLRQSNQRLQTQLTNVMMNSPRHYAMSDVLGKGDPFKVAKNEDLESCEACTGHGRIKQHPSGDVVDCDACGGSGRVPKGTAP